MKISNFRISLQKGWWLLATILVFALFWTVHSATADSGQAHNGERLITIYDRGQEQTIVTSANTVRAALEEAQVDISAVDVVEPNLDEPMTASSYNVNIYRARPVVVSDGLNKVRVMTAAQSPRQIAKAANIPLYDEDNTSMARVTDVLSDGGAGIKMNIDRATSFTLVLYGKNLSARTQATTVGAMLKEKNITLGPDDGVSIPEATPISANMSVSVWRNGVQTVTQEEVIAMPVRQIKDVDKEAGYKQVQTAGKAGKKQVTYEINTQNGQEVARKEIQSVVSEQPTEQVEVIGAKMSNTFSGSFAEALARLRSCEAGGVYDRNSGNGYYGAYQYDISTWANWGGFSRPDLAPPSVQDEKVWETYKRRGWQPWPSCKIKMGLQDIYR